MIDIDELDEKFSIEGELGFAELEEDLVFITVSNKFADADICLYGAHVTSFKPRNSMEILWMSPDSSFEEGTPIRGGIPVCFPWFGPHKT
ncbi:MAG: D-hexose-6-phosphate mutarotase, partial [Bacteroidota bacterium]|nr:D-hexose-6-phosphate mutarotase [Bacteroidota bacterium]